MASFKQLFVASSLCSLLLACGGSVSNDDDDPTGGKGGTAGGSGGAAAGGSGGAAAGGSGGAAAGGSGGVGNVGGGGIGGGGVGGGGGSCFDYGCPPGLQCCHMPPGNYVCSEMCGTGGTGGWAGGPGCCASDADCPTYYADDEPSNSGGMGGGYPTPPYWESQCVLGICKQKPPPGQCWQDSDCPYGACFGASNCPCGADCAQIDKMGWCGSPPPPPPPACCTTDWECGDFQYVGCVNGVCKQPVPGACWDNDECPLGKKCVGASVCPCMAMCAVADTPGKCL